MFFVLSKILSFLIVPFYWILILLIWLLFTKSKINKRRITIAVIIIAILFSNDFIYTKVLLAYQSYPSTLKQKTYSTGIVLGGMAGVNNKGSWLFGNGVERFIAAEELYHQKIIQKIIVTGGSGDLLNQTYKEAPFIKDELIASGVKDSDIIIESNSKNTYENAIFTKQILDSLKLKPPYLLITSALHMPRSERVFQKAKLDAIPYPCYFSIESSKNSLKRIFIPNLSRFYDWSLIFKEWLGIAAYQLTGKV
jgi:uncharacterized SAM-binding protein YcdF (DUF218 family)